MTAIFNGIFMTGCYPAQWKIAQIIVIPKPAKNPTEVTSYRPISLLPQISKVFKKLLLERIKPLVEDHIPQHQFGFRKKHNTIEQIHRMVNKINEALERKKYVLRYFLISARRSTEFGTLDYCIKSKKFCHNHSIYY